MKSWYGLTYTLVLDFVSYLKNILVKEKMAAHFMHFP